MELPPYRPKRAQKVRQSLSMTLPTEWCKFMGIKKGQILEPYLGSDGSLIVRPGAKK